MSNPYDAPKMDEPDSRRRQSAAMRVIRKQARLMRALIRPGLFFFARSGLFLAASAFVVSQWWHVEVTCSNSTNRVIGTAGVMAPGWYCNGIFHSLPASLSFNVTPSPPFTNYTIGANRVRNLFGTNFDSLTADWWFSIAGLSVGRGALNCISLRHELVLTLFVVFNFILKRAYRKRPGLKTACNETDVATDAPEIIRPELN